MIERLNKSFDHRNRLGIMTMLFRRGEMEFTELKNTLNLTDGNLATHAKFLEADGYIRIKKTFVEKKPCTTYTITARGKKAFQDHVEALLELVKKKK